jgi:SAM-dependent methyltransferase
MTDDKTISVYDNALDRYLAVPILPSHLSALHRFAARVRPGGIVLDVGSGPGLYAEHLIAAGLRVDAVDASETFVAAAVARGVDARVADFDALPGQRLYDGIWASFSLLHAPRTTVAGHVDRLAAALRPTAPFFLGMKTGTGEARDSLGRFYSYFSVPELKAMMQSAGVDVVEVITGNGKGLAGGEETYALLTGCKNA